jgi:hypothetical protein
MLVTTPIDDFDDSSREQPRVVLVRADRERDRRGGHGPRAEARFARAYWDRRVAPLREILRKFAEKRR